MQTSAEEFEESIGKVAAADRVLSLEPLAPEGRMETGWAPKEAADLSETFEQVLHRFMEHMADQVTLEEVEQEILRLAGVKGKVYQNQHGVDSCFHRGLFGLFHNLMRKSDRIETVGIRLGVSGGEAIAAEAEADGETHDQETLYKTVRDLAVYAVHTMRWLKSEEDRRANIRTAEDHQSLHPKYVVSEATSHPSLLTPDAIGTPDA